MTHSLPVSSLHLSTDFSPQVAPFSKYDTSLLFLEKVRIEKIRNLLMKASLSCIWSTFKENLGVATREKSNHAASIFFHRARQIIESGKHQHFALTYIQRSLAPFSILIHLPPLNTQLVANSLLRPPLLAKISEEESIEDPAIALTRLIQRSEPRSSILPTHYEGRTLSLPSFLNNETIFHSELLSNMARFDCRIEMDPFTIKRHLAAELAFAAKQQSKQKSFSLFEHCSGVYAAEEKNTLTTLHKDNIYLIVSPPFTAEEQMLGWRTRSDIEAYTLSLASKSQIGLAHAQGMRPTMEDAHLAEDLTLSIAGHDIPIQVFGVFDGHSGPLVARALSIYLPGMLKDLLEQNNAFGLNEAGITQALQMVLPHLQMKLYTDKSVLPLPNGNCTNWQETLKEQGSTAVFAVRMQDKLWVANTGDSRALYISPTGETKQISADAIPSMNRHRTHIEATGHSVLTPPGDVPRIDGMLAPACTIGDLKYGVAAQSTSRITCISPEKEGTLLLGCDGVFDVASSNAVGNLVHARKSKGDSTASIAFYVAYAALASGSTDNVSVMCVAT